jgi:hypothetical protein
MHADDDFGKVLVACKGCSIKYVSWAVRRWSVRTALAADKDNGNGQVAKEV